MEGLKRLVKKGRVVLIQLKEGVVFTWNELKNNKFRTFLSLLGVSIGIFTIVAIFTAVDALKTNVKKGFESMSSNMVQISKWPFGPEDEEGNVVLDGSGGFTEYRWWDYLKRPDITYNHFKFLKANSKLAEDFLFVYNGSGSVKYGRNTASNVGICCSTDALEMILKINIDKGRMITRSEFEGGNLVAVLGNAVASSLFQEEDPIGRIIKVKGYSFAVVGVMEKQGQSIVDINDTDDGIFIPYLAGKMVFGLREPDGTLNATPKKGVTSEELAQELRLLMRQARRIRLGQKNDFSVNQISTLTEMLDNLLGIIRTVGWIIAAFSLLIGGFGIANIMFVSVKERTKIIGIQKALGAKRYFIMTQFLAEALILAVAGALVGVLMVALILWIAPIPAEYDVHLTFGNILSGVAIASVIGILSGLLPAWSAARLNPVDAINSK